MEKDFEEMHWEERQNMGDYVFKWKKADLASDTYVKLWKED